MIHMTLQQAADILETNANAPHLSFQGISIDTRKIEPNQLFIAIPGEQVDGHDFIEEARKKGASAALVNRFVESELPQIKVNDTILAMGKLGAAWRHQFNLPIVAVTGSNGKTTLKNMIASILIAACGNDKTHVLATKGTLNNHLGLPLTLAELNHTHRYGVIEMGMNHFGEIEYLTQLTQPDVALITNAAAAHLEGVGDLAGVARAKGEIFLGLSPKGTAILNRDDHFFSYWQELVGKRTIISFGLHDEANVTLVSQQNDTTIINTPQGQIDIRLPLLGQHNIVNMLAATAAACALNIPLSAIKKGLETIAPAPGRLQLHKLKNGVNLIDDTYNANPFSLQAAVDTLAHFTGKKILVLGDMKELGEQTTTLHHDAGKKIRAAGIDYLFTYGELSAHTAQAFGEGAYHFNTQDKLITAVKPLLYNQTTVLVKGSRSMRMEKIVHQLSE